jgi:hypothetical protein
LRRDSGILADTEPTVAELCRAETPEECCDASV